MLELKNFFTVSGASCVFKVPRSTLQYAIKRGELSVSTLGCGKQVLKLQDLDQWVKNPRSVGRKPNA